MLLAIDVGNTQTVMGVYPEGEMRAGSLAHMWRMATCKTDTPDELRLKFEALLGQAGLARQHVKGACLCSVVPALGDAWEQALHGAFGVEPVVCSAKSAGDLFQTTYQNPSEIGADRVADAVAARALYGYPVVVVDFGTATNIEVVDAQGQFAGGIIAPGFNASADALIARATKLAAVDLVDPGVAIGRNTAEAMQAGIVYGEADRIDGLVGRIFDQLGYTAPVVATGGLAPKLAPLTRTVTEINPELTLEGLRLVYQRQCHVE